MDRHFHGVYIVNQATLVSLLTLLSNPSTVGVDIGEWTFEKRDRTSPATHGPVVFRTWDFGGQTEYYATHQYFLSKRSLYLVRNLLIQSPQLIQLLFVENFRVGLFSVIFCHKSEETAQVLSKNSSILAPLWFRLPNRFLSPSISVG